MDTVGTELAEGVRTPPPAMLASGALRIGNPMGGRLRFLQVISFPVPGIQGGSPPQPPPPAEETLVFTRFAPLKSLVSLLCGPPRVCLSSLWTMQRPSQSSGVIQSPSLLSETPKVRLPSLDHPDSPCPVCIEAPMPAHLFCSVSLYFREPFFFHTFGICCENRFTTIFLLFGYPNITLLTL